MKIRLNLRLTPFEVVMTTSIIFTLIYAVSLWLDRMVLVNQVLPAVLFLICS